MIEVECPHCGHTLRIPSQYQGMAGRCNRCGGELEVPTARTPSGDKFTRHFARGQRNKWILAGFGVGVALLVLSLAKDQPDKNYTQGDSDLNLSNHTVIVASPEPLKKEKSPSNRVDLSDSLAPTIEAVQSEQMWVGYSRKDFEIYTALMRSSSASENEALASIAKTFGKSPAEIKEIYDNVSKVAFARDCAQLEEQIRLSLEKDASIRALNCAMAFVGIKYLDSTATGDSSTIAKLTIDRMTLIAGKIFLVKGVDRIRLNAAMNDGDTTIATLEICRFEWNPQLRANEYKGYRANSNL